MGPGVKAGGPTGTAMVGKLGTMTHGRTEMSIVGAPKVGLWTEALLGTMAMGMLTPCVPPAHRTRRRPLIVSGQPWQIACLPKSVLELPRVRPVKQLRPLTLKLLERKMMNLPPMGLMISGGWTSMGIPWTHQHCTCVSTEASGVSWLINIFSETLSFVQDAIRESRLVMWLMFGEQPRYKESSTWRSCPEEDRSRSQQLDIESSNTLLLIYIYMCIYIYIYIYIYYYNIKLTLKLFKVAQSYLYILSPHPG